MSRLKYKFSHRSNDGQTYYWVSEQRVAGSLSYEIRCNVDYFWRQGRWAA